MLYSISRRNKAISLRMLWDSYIYLYKISQCVIVPWKHYNTNCEAHDRWVPDRQLKHIQIVCSGCRHLGHLEKKFGKGGIILGTFSISFL